MYAAGLSTQVAPKLGLAFKQRHDPDAFLAKARKPMVITDDEGDDASENEYELGSFVCDDEDMLFDSE
jgi:ATP-dependent DNA helicase MPH1